MLEKNPEYGGAYPAKNDRAIVQYFDKSSALKLAVEQGDVDVAYRSFSPTDLEDLKSAGGVNVVGGKGTEIRYLVFNDDLQPGDNDAQKLAIRRAVAYTIDRARDRRERLRRHRAAALLDGPAGARVRDRGVQGRVRRLARPQRGQGGARRRPA